MFVGNTDAFHLVTQVNTSILSLLLIECQER